MFQVQRKRRRKINFVKKKKDPLNQKKKFCFD